MTLSSSLAAAAAAFEAEAAEDCPELAALLMTEAASALSALRWFSARAIWKRASGSQTNL